ncbi:hypothetical protein CYR75_15150 (plasmid) [Paracoccus jeotgali]|uniref:HTH cro/C1-type domain-containing protein n=2 Tax=Paracoccus jeotgali TaxID=2065379 RepID=A0A2K9MMB9_9RHOB|nr:hypothetical protein CYR75_15150 [Paracoccus jeotgali]
MPLTPIFTAQMQRLDLTRTTLARQSGISTPTLRKIMRGGGTIGSLSRCLPHLDLGWSWVPHPTLEAGAGLATLRRRQGMTQAEVAERLKISRPVIIRIEKRMQGELASLRGYASLLGFRSPIAPLRGKRRLIPAPNSADRDRVMTPPALAQEICAHFAPHLQGTLLDPARADGAFYESFPGHLRREWCEIEAGRDFLDWREPVDWIITNPPWSLLPEFLEHSMTVADNIVFLAPLTNLTTKARLRMIDRAGFGIAELVKIDTPRDWPQSGFQLVAGWLRRGHLGDCRMSRLESHAP